MKLITYPTSGSLKNTTSDKAGKFCGSPLRQLGYFTGLANVIASLSISFLFITSPVVSNVHSLEQKYITDPHVSWLPPPDLELYSKLLSPVITAARLQYQISKENYTPHFTVPLVVRGVFSSVSEQTIWQT